MYGSEETDLWKVKFSLRDEFFFIGIQPCELNSSEAIRDIDPHSFGGPS